MKNGTKLVKPLRDHHENDLLFGITFSTSVRNNKAQRRAKKTNQSKEMLRKKDEKSFLENNKKTIFSLAKRTKTAMPVSHSHDAHSAYNLSRDSEGRRKRFFSTVVVFVSAVAR